MSERRRQARYAVTPGQGKDVPLSFDRVPMPVAGQPRHGRWRPATCQFIAGEPAPNDIGKCGQPVRPGSSFCPMHHEICWFPPEQPSPAN